MRRGASVRLWYVRRGVSWTPLLAFSGAALVVAALTRQWPDAAFLLQPVALACCTAAAAFVFDEAAVTVVAVTPRGSWWSRSSRLLVAGLPLAAWGGVLALLPPQVDLDVSSWLVVGAASVGTAAGLSGLLSRRLHAAPGAALSAALAGLLFTPLVIGSLAGWDPVFPQGDFQGWVLGFWLGVAGLAVGAIASTLRPGVR